MVRWRLRVARSAMMKSRSEGSSQGPLMQACHACHSFHFACLCHSDCQLLEPPSFSADQAHAFQNSCDWHQEKRLAAHKCGDLNILQTRGGGDLSIPQAHQGWQWVASTAMSPKFQGNATVQRPGWRVLWPLPPRQEGVVPSGHQPEGIAKRHGLCPHRSSWSWSSIR